MRYHKTTLCDKGREEEGERQGERIERKEKRKKGKYKFKFLQQKKINRTTNTFVA